MTIQANNDAPQDELEAITNLKDIILGNKNNGITKDKAVEPVNVTTPINNAQPSKETTLIPTEEKMDIQNTLTLGLDLPSPSIISQDYVEDTPDRYNLQSRAQSIAKSIIEPHLMPTLKLNTPNKKLNHGYASAYQALQIKELSSKIQANPEACLANAIIDID